VANPNSGESRAIAELLAALSHPDAPTAFTAARLAAFSGPTVALVVATVAMYVERLYSREECSVAADLIKGKQ
jgi:hypothetical protein